MARVVVRGVGDVGSAVAHRLFGAGFDIIAERRDGCKVG